MAITPFAVKVVPTPITTFVTIRNADTLFKKFLIATSVPVIVHIGTWCFVFSGVARVIPFLRCNAGLAVETAIRKINNDELLTGLGIYKENFLI